MKAFLVKNRDLTPDSTGYIHLLPAGTHKTIAKVDGKEAEVDMLVDDAALALVMETYQRDSAAPNWTGYLVDKEHFSHDVNQTSEAYAWLKTLQRRADGIWGLPEWTTLGKDAIEGKIYKHLSPVVLLREVTKTSGRAFALTDVGLTNKPRLKTLIPIQNRDDGKGGPQVAGSKGDSQVAPKETQSMDQICALLGLPAGSPEADVIANIKALLTAQADGAKAVCRAAYLEKELTTLKTEALNRDADAFVALHKDKITDAAKVKEIFVKNREAAESFVALLKPAQETTAAGTQKTLNREDGKTPQITAEDQKLATRAEKIAEIQKAKGCSFADAVHVLRSTNRELF